MIIVILCIGSSPSTLWHVLKLQVYLTFKSLWAWHWPFTCHGTEIDPWRSACLLLSALQPVARCNSSVSYRCHWTPLMKTGMIGYARHLSSLETTEPVRIPLSRPSSLYIYRSHIFLMTMCLSARMEVMSSWRWILPEWQCAVWDWPNELHIAYMFGERAAAKSSEDIQEKMEAKRQEIWVFITVFWW